MMDGSTRRYLIAYDISNDWRRDRIRRALQAYGDRVQYSVFVADIRPAKLVRLRTQIEALMDRRADSVLLCDLGLADHIDARRFEFLGRAAHITPHGPLVL